MNKTDKKFEEIKAYYKKEAKAHEKQLHMDLWAVRHEYVPHHLKKKFLSGCAIFGMTYLLEHAIFGKKLPFTVKFTGALAATVLSPRLFRKLEDKVLGIGEMEPIRVEEKAEGNTYADVDEADEVRRDLPHVAPTARPPEAAETENTGNQSPTEVPSPGTDSSESDEINISREEKKRDDDSNIPHKST
jgi:hypothetical protein